ncbi:hypothetical protein IL306_003807 [Fusarium sp. DS 682]|nr:hypothetical protein IL306_003807 [Fusarium sp. DS 682]
MSEEQLNYLKEEWLVEVRKRKTFDPKEQKDFNQSLQSQYSEFLGLPLDIENGCPFTFAIAHEVHGFQMRTRWTQHPPTFEDRLNIDNENNILIETQSSNYYKHNFAASYYPLLKDRAIDIHVPIELANEDLPLSPFNQHLELKIKYGSIALENFVVDDEEEEVYVRAQDDFQDSNDTAAHESKLRGQESTETNGKSKFDTLNF